MKICFYNHTGQVSGAEKVLFSVLAGINPKEDEAVVFAPESVPFEAFCNERHISFYPVASLTARYTSNPHKLATYLISFLHLIRELRRHLQREKPDLIHANTARGAIVATLATIGIKRPVFWHIHDMMPRHPISSLIRMLAVLSGKNKVIAVSHATANRFAGKLPKWLLDRAPIEVIHNGIDTGLFCLNRDGVVPFLSEIGLDASHFRMGIIGQITPRKGHLELIRALAPLFKNNLPNARLLIVGAAMFNNDLDYLELLKSETQRLGLDKQILFVGPRNAAVVMKSLDVLIHNSSSEPFGLVVAEAMASGIPVVAAAVDGVPEIIENGSSGFLFNLGDSQTLLAHVMTCATKPAVVESIVRQGRSRVTRLFDETMLQARVVALFRTVQPRSVDSSPLQAVCSSSSRVQ